MIRALCLEIMSDRPFAGSACLVTGGAGFIGSNLVRALAGEGAQVTVLDNLAAGRREHLHGLPAKLVEDDVSRGASLADLAPRSDYIFHLAAQVGNIKSIQQTGVDAETNILGTVQALRACQGSAVRKFVYASSSAIFGETDRISIDEAHPQKPASFYALSKLTGEKYAVLAAELWSVAAVCLRFFNVYGLPMEANEYSGVIPIFLERLERRQPLLIYGDGRQVRDFVYVADVVQAIMLAALRGPMGSIYNVGTGQATTILTLANTLMEVTGIQAPIEYGDWRAGEVRRSLADISKARAELGYNPQYDLRRGLAELWRSHQRSAAARET